MDFKLSKTPSMEVSSPSSLSLSDAQDAADMARLGKKQQLHRNFNLWSTMAFGCVLMITWEALLTTFIFGLANGGPAGLVYGFIFVWLGYWLVNMSLAELMSMYPTSGGQYHWTYTLAPASWAPFLSYICGWQTVIAWQAAVASVTYLAATLIQGLLVLNYPGTYHFQRWHGVLLIYAVQVLDICFCTFGNRFLPLFDYVALFIHVGGFIAVVAAVAALSPSKASTHEVFEVWFNNGYSSQGLSFLVGLQGLVFAWLGADGAIHMAEEIKGASKVVPWSLMGSVLINGLQGFGIILVVLFYGPSEAALEEALASPTGYPIQAILKYATGSVAGGTGLSVILVMMQLVSSIMVVAAGSRELWAFARDNGLPFSKYISRVDKSSRLPLWSMLITATVTALLALINIGSSIAFNAIISLTIAGFVVSYAFPIVLLLWRRVQALRNRGPQLPWGPWWLGSYGGIVINILSLCWILLIFVFSFFPVEPLPGLTVQTMNWSSLAYGASMVFAMAFWFVHGRRTYKGPVRDAVGGEIEGVLGQEGGEGEEVKG